MPKSDTSAATPPRWAARQPARLLGPRVRTSLAPHLGRSPTDPEILDRFRLRAFVEQRVAIVRLDAVVDPWVRQAIVNETSRQLAIPIPKPPVAGAASTVAGAETAEETRS
jgi:hypothetical protein